MTEAQEVIQELGALTSHLGVREALKPDRMRELHLAGKHQALAAEIARCMGIPVSIGVGKTSPRNRFSTTGLSPTDASGHGTHGIEAQISIPSDIPLFGSSALNGFRIDCTFRDGFGQLPPDTAITILAHELGHVLLHALRHPRRESEMATDLVPLLCGFVDIVAQGRTLSSTTAPEMQVTYGYLTDFQFSLARFKIYEMLEDGRELRAQVLVKLDGVSARSREAASLRGQCRNLLRSVDASGQLFRSTDATQVVAMHLPGYFDTLDNIVRGLPSLLEEGRRLAGALSPHFSEHGLIRLRAISDWCNDTHHQLDSLRLRLAMDLRVLQRNRSRRANLLDHLKSAPRWISHGRTRLLWFLAVPGILLMILELSRSSSDSGTIASVNTQTSPPLTREAPQPPSAPVAAESLVDTAQTSPTSQEVSEQPGSAIAPASPLVTAQPLRPSREERLALLEARACERAKGQSRLLSGAALLRSSSNQDGKLKVENGTDHDAVVVLVGGHTTIEGVFVRAHDTAVFGGVPDGSYEVQYALGNGWRRAQKGFCEPVDFGGFDTAVMFKTTEEYIADSVVVRTTVYEITLHPVVGGTARTHPIPSDSFAPGLLASDRQ